MKRIALSFITIALIAGSAISLSGAFFSDSEKSTQNTMTAGRLDLLVNGQNNPTGIVNLDDLKPGDNREVHKTLFVDFNPARIFLHLKSSEASQGAQTEPELLEEAIDGPKFDLQNYLTYDLTASGSTIIASGAGILLPDAVSCWIPLGTIPGNTVVPVEQSFHFDPTVTNWAQGDVITFTEEFLALQANDPTMPDTGSGRVWSKELHKCVPRETPTPTVSPTPTPLACGTSWASSVVSSSQGVRKNGTAVLATRTDPSTALIAQTIGNAFDSPVTEGTFYSLGFKNNGTTPGGELVVSFASPVFNGPGSDLRIFEVTGGPPYPDEKVKVEARLTGADPWVELSPALIKDGYVDLGVLSAAQYVRLTEVSAIGSFEATADGYDVDGVQALCAQGV